MTHAPMPESLLAQMEALARLRHHESPQRITQRAAAEEAAREPKRTKVLYWLREIHTDDA